MLNAPGQPDSHLAETTSSDRGPMLGRFEFGPFSAGLIYYWLTGNIVVLGLTFGAEYLKGSSRKGYQFNYAGEYYANWDGQWYKKIAAQGYEYTPGSRSSVAFFPAFPLLGRAVSLATGTSVEVSLVFVSNFSLIVLFYLAAKYVNIRFPESGGLADRILLAIALLPTSFFFRMAYSESLFVTLVVLVLYGIRRGWPLPVIAGIVGMATAARPVGVALIPALVIYIRRRSPGRFRSAVKTAFLIPIACWGIIAFMAYQYMSFGDPLAFVRTQASWKLRPPTPIGRRVFELATLEPVLAVYRSSSPSFWARTTGALEPFFCLRAADPIYFLVAIVMVAVGAIRRWLCDYEVVTSVGLLLIPYVTIGYDQYMQSMGRYSCAAFPVYLVMGQLLSRLPGPIVSILAGLSGFLLGAYAALFAAWYVFI